MSTVGQTTDGLEPIVYQDGIAAGEWASATGRCSCARLFSESLFMRAYRLYFLDANGAIRRALELDCDCDEAAIETASRHLGVGAMELWDRDRVVKTFSVNAPGEQG